jgi:hypothetical protein
MLGTCRQLRQGTNNYVSIVELSFNAIERSFQLYLVDRPPANSSDYPDHGQVFDDVASSGVFSDAAVADRIDAFRSEHRSRISYDVDRPGRDLADGMHDLAEEVHAYVVNFSNVHSRCRCTE